MGQDIANNFNPMHYTQDKIKSFSNNVSFIHIKQLWKHSYGSKGQDEVEGGWWWWLL